jgi:hypothetical protein
MPGAMLSRVIDSDPFCDIPAIMDGVRIAHA